MKKLLSIFTLLFCAIFSYGVTLSVTDVKISINPVSIGETTVVTGKVTNLTDDKYEGNISLMLKSAPNGFYNIDPFTVEKITVSLEGHASENIEIPFKFSDGSDERFLLYFNDKQGNLISDYYNFQLGQCNTEVESIEIPIHTFGLKVGLTECAMVSILPGSAPQVATWTSSDENIVVIESLRENGIYCNFKCVGPGTAYLTATAVNGMTASCKVNVSPSNIKVESVILDIHEFTGEIGDQVQLQATVLPENATLPYVIFHSMNNKVATVSNDGLVTIVGEGQTEIWADSVDNINAKDMCLINGVSGIEAVCSDNKSSKTANIYSIDGRTVIQNAGHEDLQKLTKGIYIYNGKKIIIK